MFMEIWITKLKSEKGLKPFKNSIRFLCWSRATAPSLAPLIFSYSFTAGVPFPKNFLSIAKTILKRLFRVYAHIYHQHFLHIVGLGEEAHLNTSFKHFMFFVQEFGLVDKRELAPLQELIEKLTNKDKV